MRTQRRTVTVRILLENVTEDALGNETDQPRTRVIEGCVFDPGLIDERSTAGQVGVLRVGTLNIPGRVDLTSDDTVKIDGTAWQVIGGGNFWRDRTKVQVQQARTR